MPKQSQDDVMDGAVFVESWRDKTPKDFVAPEGTKLRPGQAQEPWGRAEVDLRWGVAGRTLPPRSVWAQGEWEGNTKGKWNRWVVSGEGTPGNYVSRVYILPEDVCGETVPKHPSDWPKKLRETRDSWSSPVSAGNGLPYSLRVRCTGCGHFYKMDDLSDHAGKACPATQGEIVLWVMECQCHPGDILAAAKVMDGFPIRPPQNKTPDKSGNKKGGEEAGNYVSGGSSRAESKTSTGA